MNSKRTVKIRGTLVILFLILLMVGGNYETVEAQGICEYYPGYCFYVENTADTGFGSLRQAILDANSWPGMDTILFEIPAITDPGCDSSSEVCTIQPLSALPTITEPILILGFSQPGTIPNTNPPDLGSNAQLKIEIDGSNAGVDVSGLHITAENSIIAGLVINRFQGDGIHIQFDGASGNQILSNFLGTDITGTVDYGNRYAGVRINDAPDNIVGYETPEGLNLISGNENGVVIQGPEGASNASGNQVLGNLIGTDATGTIALGNSHHGIYVGDATNNTIGPSNVISGNDIFGILLIDDTSGNQVIGNHIGTDITGTASLANHIGVHVLGAPGNTIGGDAPSERNIISGNIEEGVLINGGASIGNVISGNYIGTDIIGSAPLANTGNGIRFDNQDGTPSNNIIGGTGSGEGNVISANSGDGITLAYGSSDNQVLGNLIGTDNSGTIGMENGGNGVQIFGSPNNTIGGPNAESRNIISGNGINGVMIFDSLVLPDATGNVIQGNYIGTDITGNLPIGNNEDGINVFNAANNTIGGTTAGAGNVISGNGLNGVRIVIPGASGNVVQGNLIGTNADGDTRIGNGYAGVEIQNAPNNIVGGNLPGADNVIAGNRDGIFINSSFATGNVIEGNFIGTDLYGNIAIGNTRQGIFITHAPANTIRNSTIAFNGGDGVGVLGGAAINNIITENSIHANMGKGIENSYGGNVELVPPLILEMLGDQIAGTAPANSIVEIFADDDGEGRTYLGTSFADGLGYFSYSGAFEGPNLTASATDADGNTSEFSVSVPWAPDNCEINDTFEQACDAGGVLGLNFNSPGIFESFLSRPGDVDWFYIDLPEAATPGSHVTFNLSGVGGADLPANFDIAVLTELEVDLTTGATPLQGVPLQGVPLQGVPLQGVPLQGVDAESVPLQGVPLQGVDVNDIPLQGVPLQGVPLQGVPLQGVPLQGVPLQGVGFHQGIQPEIVTTLFRGGMTGRYYIMVWSSTGEFSTNPGDSPYELTVTIDEVSVDTCPTALAGIPLTNAIEDPLGNTSYPETLFLINQPRMNALYGEAETASLLETLVSNAAANLADHPRVNGMVVDLGAYLEVMDAYAYWDLNGCDPEAANLVTLEVKKVINALLSTHDTISNLVLVGNDLIIPMRRVPDEVVRTPDGATIPNEFDYQVELDDGTRMVGGISIDNSPTLATLQHQYYLSDDFYADLAPVLLEHGHELSVPDIPIGRLVEYPWEIRSYIQTFLALDGSMVAAGAEPVSFTTGYSFLIDQAMAIDSILTNKGFSSEHDLISDDWTDEDFIGALIYQPVVNSINSHTDHWQLAPPVAEPDDGHIVRTIDPEFINEQLAGTIIFSVGCHLGFNFVDQEAFDPTEDGVYDFPQALIQHGGTLIGNWGFGYGDDAALAYSEELMTDFARNLGNSSIGQSLVAVKREYLLNQAILDPVHEKVLMEAVLFGLPMWDVSAPVEDLPDGISVDVAQGPSGELTVLEYDVAVINNQLEEVAIPDRGSFYSLAGRTQAALFHPIQPKSSLDVNDGLGEVAHGVLFTGGNYIEISNFDPVITMPSWTRTNPEPQFLYEGWDPPRFWSLAQLEGFDGTFDERLVIIPGQFLVDATATIGTGITTGTQRLYQDLEFDVVYAPASYEFLPPIIHSVDAAVSDSGVLIMVQVEDPETIAVESSGIDEVLITYTESEGGSTWQSTKLAVINPSSGLWGTTLNVSGAIDFFVQAVDGSGNVGMFAGNGYFTPVIVDINGPSTAVVGQPISFTSNSGADPQTTNFLWDFGDGTMSSGEDTVVHAFSQSGSYTVSVKAVDNFGNIGEDTWVIFIGDNLDPDLHDVFTQIIALIRVVDQLPDEAFRNSADDRKYSLVIKLSEVGIKIFESDYKSAIKKLNIDILKKMDGCPPSADKNDWIIDCTEQVRMQGQIGRLIDAIEALK